MNTYNWAKLARGWPRASGEPPISGTVKSTPADFVVREQMPVQPSGQGEHVWLQIRKTRSNTEQLAKAIARHAGVSYRDVGYSGLKDYFAVSEQWFSVWLPKQPAPDWSLLNSEHAELLQVVQHNRKLKRGTHRGNAFEITVRSVKGDPVVLQQRLQQIAEQGVPNYFGEQRFGRDFGNMVQVRDWFAGGQPPSGRHLRSLLISSARSWLFNSVVAARIVDNSWQSLLPGEPANLDGGNSIFIATGEPNEAQRLKEMDIHPTAPLWGDGAADIVSDSSPLGQLECMAMQRFGFLQQGLQQARANYQRRSLRSKLTNLLWSLDNDTLHLSFELQRGQFATSMLRELLI
ncbi:MAG: tRNA pseudouridine(13) synthase TruD [Gammaproteobacteria bacterium]|nr:tRNA pseudouridine(13) synthase TruD [Gammaproteobacteria bacterium]